MVFAALAGCCGREQHEITVCHQRMYERLGAVAGQMFSHFKAGDEVVATPQIKLL